MAATAKDVLERVGILLQDEDATRWPLAERLMWLNDGQREIVLMKPNALSETVALALAPGTLQRVPEGYLSLIGITRNLSGAAPSYEGGRVVRPVSRESLDASMPDWHSASARRPIVRNFVYDAFDLTTFYIYPGNDGAGRVEAILSVKPLPITLASVSDPEDIASYALPLSVDDIYLNALVDYVLYRANSKDSGDAGALTRAAAAYQQFANGIGVKLQNERSANPNRPNPTVGGTSAASMGA
mgnify:CR=1 FL=1